MLMTGSTWHSREKRMLKLFKQLMKFGVVGVIATGIDFALMIALTEWASWDPVLSAGVSFTVSLLFNYAASMRFVFTRRDDLSRSSELAIFAVLSLVGLAINEALMWLGVNVFSLNYVLVKVFATAVVMLWNFASRKRWLDASWGRFLSRLPTARKPIASTLSVH